MTVRKTESERIADLEKKQAQTKTLIRQLKQKEAEKNRKARNRRLIMIGAVVESVYGKPIEEKALPRLKHFLESQESRGHFFSRAMAEEAAE